MTYMTSAGQMPAAGRLGILSHLAHMLRIRSESRRTVRALRALDDHQLADIGLARHEIRQLARNVAIETLAGTTRAE